MALTSAELQIRPVAGHELDKAVRLLGFLNPEIPLEEVRSRLYAIRSGFPNYELFGAFDASSVLLGVAGAWVATKMWCGRYLEIDNLVVDPDARQGGVGTALMEFLEAHGRELGCTVLALDSYAGNRASHRLYHRLGFEIWAFHFIKPVGKWSGKVEQ